MCVTQKVSAPLDPLVLGCFFALGHFVVLRSSSPFNSVLRASGVDREVVLNPKDKELPQFWGPDDRIVVLAND